MLGFIKHVQKLLLFMRTHQHRRVAHHIAQHTYLLNLCVSFLYLSIKAFTLSLGAHCRCSLPSSVASLYTLLHFYRCVFIQISNPTRICYETKQQEEEEIRYGRFECHEKGMSHSWHINMLKLTIYTLTLFARSNKRVVISFFFPCSLSKQSGVHHFIQHL